MSTILFLSANPDGTDKLELIKECNIINQKIRSSAGRELFKLEQRHDISIKSLIEELLNYNPQILHFSGHGSDKSALIFKNENTKFSFGKWQEWVYEANFKWYWEKKKSTDPK